MHYRQSEQRSKRCLQTRCEEPEHISAAVQVLLTRYLPERHFSTERVRPRRKLSVPCRLVKAVCQRRQLVFSFHGG